MLNPILTHQLRFIMNSTAGEDKEQPSTNIWIATTLALCLLIVGVTTTACLCIRRKKGKNINKCTVCYVLIFVNDKGLNLFYLIESCMDNS